MLGREVPFLAHGDLSNINDMAEAHLRVIMKEGPHQQEVRDYEVAIRDQGRLYSPFQLC